MATDDERRKPLRGVAVADFQWLVRVPGSPSSIQVFIDEADAHAYAGSKGTVELLLGAGDEPEASTGPEDPSADNVSETAEKNEESSS